MLNLVGLQSNQNKQFPLKYNGDVVFDKYKDTWINALKRQC